MQALKVGIIGCGLIGRRRAEVAKELGDNVVAVHDVVVASAKRLAIDIDAYQCDVDTLIQNSDVVVVATPHHSLAEYALMALQAGKHVLVEKPGGISSIELCAMRDMAERLECALVVGYNHVFHPAIAKAYELVEMERVLLVRGRYGHGGRRGYEKEWRSKLDYGGGELLDKGTHLIDLASYFIGAPLCVEAAMLPTLYWNMAVEDNAFLLMKGKAGQVAQLHASSTDWKNTFSLEIYTSSKKLHIEGLGGSYGTERLSVYQNNFGPPSTLIYEYPGPDVSWKAEWVNFRSVIGSLDQESIVRAVTTMELVEQARARAICTSSPA